MARAALGRAGLNARAREMLGFLPCGRTHGSHEQLVSLFWSLDMATLDAVREAGFEAWGARVVELEPKAAGLVDELRRRGGLDALIPAAYSDTWMPQYHHGAASPKKTHAAPW